MGCLSPSDYMPTPDRIVLLTNFVLPYRVPVLRELARRCKALRILTSTRTFEGKECASEREGVPARIQKNLTWRSTCRHPHGFNEPLTVQIPYDTLAQLARFDPDVVISGEMGLRTLQAAAFAWFSNRRRLVLWATVSESTEQGRGFLRPLLRKVLLNAADAVIVNGASGARYVRRFGIESEKVFLVPQTTEVASFLRARSDKSSTLQHRLFYCGRLIERKGLIPFLSRLAAWAVRNPGKRIEFSIAGDGPMRSAIAEFRCPSNLVLRMLGDIPYERLPQVYAGAGILAFPTLADEWGLVVVEAMATGLPVLGSIYSQAVEDLVTDGVSGWTFHPDRQEEMDAALDRALGATVDEVDAMGARARESVRDMTPGRMADQIMRAVEYACAPHRRTVTRSPTV
jgi:glycosyltransferase involved in cell wall biosynthesis